jgi:opacity protein-like surface antigen
MRNSMERTRMLRIALASTCALAAALLLAPAALAADIYLSGGLGNSTGTGSADVETDFYTASGEDTDSAPTYGGTIGLAFPMNEAVPVIKGFELPGWVVRTELEYMMGRDFELKSDGAAANDFFLSEADAWTVMPNFSVEVPLREPIAWLFGRIPVLEPMSIYGNVGLGIAQVNLEASDNNSDVDESSLNFAWQGGAGINYSLTDTTSFVLGWRYVSLGTTEGEVKNLQGGGDFELDLSGHEIMTGLRINFYSAPLKDMHPRYWRMPRVPVPGWLPSWLGGPSDDDGGSDPDDL